MNPTIDLSPFLELGGTLGIVIVVGKWLMGQIERKDKERIEAEKIAREEREIVERRNALERERAEIERANWLASLDKITTSTIERQELIGRGITEMVESLKDHDSSSAEHQTQMLADHIEMMMRLNGAPPDKIE